MLFAFTFDISENVIKIYYNKSVEFLGKNLIDIALEYDWYIGQSKKLYLILQMAIKGHKSHVLFIAFFDPHLMVGIGQIKLSKTLSPI